MEIAVVVLVLKLGEHTAIPVVGCVFFFPVEHLGRPVCLDFVLILVLQERKHGQIE
jgi:hypothetical protein